MVLPDVQFFLSRPSYPLGGTLVGTILIRRPQNVNSNKKSEDSSNTNNEEEESLQSLPEQEESLRELLDSVTVYVAGFCKIDARWHNIMDYTKIYGRIHPYVQLLEESFDPDLLATSADTVCFFATNGMEALELPERKGGRWDGIQHKKDVLAFTFAVHIPNDLPHSSHSTTCRYFYSANVLVKTGTQQQILKRGFQVTTHPHDQGQALSSLAAPQKETVNTGRVKFGNCVGMAHSNGLPCHLTSSEIQRPTGQMTVVQRDFNRSTQYDVQTIRVSNSKGQLACMLTLIGTQTMVPGSSVHIQWDFPKQQSNEIIPCYQVSACLQGEECALFEDGTTKRTKSLLFDTCHEFVDPGVTDYVCKTMILSGDSSVEATPCNISTDIMKVSIWCQVDITVMEGSDEYNNLSFQIPCRIRHWLVNGDEEMELEENRVAPLMELMGTASKVNSSSNDETKNNDVDVFQTKDIVPDMKILSIAMEERLGSRVQA